MPANANCGLWRPIARLPAASVPAGGPTSTPLSDPSSAQQSDAVSMLMPLYDKRYRDKLRSHRVEQLHFGFRIARRIFGGDRLASWLGGGFFMIAPAFIWRSIGHFSL